MYNSAINADNGEANKVRNVVNDEIGAVPAVARFYKVINVKACDGEMTHRKQQK